MLSRVTKLRKEKILDQLVRLPKLVQENRWLFDYDSYLDELFFGIDELPTNAFLFNINHEINLFITPDSEVKGMLIKYFAVDYVRHNTDMKPVLDILNDEESHILAQDEEKVDLAKSALEGRLLSDTLESLLKRTL